MERVRLSRGLSAAEHTVSRLLHAFLSPLASRFAGRRPRPRLRQPLRLRLSRPASGFAGGLVMFLGFVLLADAVVTVVWREPITTVFAQQQQKALDKELVAIERSQTSSPTLSLVKNAITKEERMAILARHERGSSQTGDPLGRIAIPKLGIKFVLVAGSGEDSLKKGPGHYVDTALPGERGTVGIAGHRTTYLAPFRHLDRMRVGDQIVLTMPYGRFTYGVEAVQVVPPSQASVLASARHERLVLTTCTPLFSAKRRLVVMARLKQSTPRGPTLDQKPVPPLSPL